MNRTALLILLVSLSSLVEQAHTQVYQHNKVWNLADCFKYAEEHNIQINTLRMNERSAQQDLWAAKGLKIPSLSASLNNTFENANNPVDGGNRLVNQLSSTGVYAMNASIVIWNGLYINNTIRQSQLLLEQAGLSVQQSQNNITLMITSAYLTILLSKENLKYVQDLVSTSEARVTQGKQLFDAGSIAKKDLLQLEAQLSSDRYLMVQTQNTIRQNILTLKQILQLPGETPFEIVVPDSVSILSPQPSLSVVQQTAMREFPEIKIGKTAMEVARLDIEMARAGAKPILKASGGLGTGYSSPLTNAITAKAAYLTQAGNNFYQLAGLNLYIPIFSNRVNRANVAKAIIAYQEARLNYENAKLVLAQAIEQSYLNVNNALQSYAAAQSQLQAATESYRIGNEAFKLGAINIYDLLEQRNQYVQAVQAFTQAKYSAVLQQKIYEFYMGSPVTL